MATDNAVQLGKTVRSLRLKRGWRQIDLAAHTGINKTHICDLECGRHNFSLKTLECLAGAFDMKPSELLRKADI